jgi:ABC-type nitrate/sulfonate/bicarbonate transport system ATPase subunit
VSEALLEAHGLAAARAGTLVVRGVDLTLRRGDVLAVLGPNGAGKSTLLAALTGLIPPAAGSVVRHGRVAAALQAPALANRSARANVEAALAWWGVPRRARRDRALAALRSTGAAHLQDRPAAGLSGGEARRVHLARAVALEPEILLLDEPFAGLDAPTRADLLDDAAAALTDPRRATIVVVHDRAEAWAIADRVLVLLDGFPAASGPVREVLETPPTPEVAAFLGFSGRLQLPDGALRMLKPGHATLDPAGDVTATVTRCVPVEDGVRLELTLPNGRLHTVSPLPGPQPGESVRLRLAPGVRFAAPGRQRSNDALNRVSESCSATPGCRARSGSKDST